MRRVGDQQVDVVVLAVHLDQLGAEIGADAGEHAPKHIQVLAGQHPASVLGHKDQMHVERGDNVSASTAIVLAKARHRVAVAHRKVRDRRADHHHKLALRLIRDNQAVAVEDLYVAGLGRTRLAKSVHDAGWAMFVRLLEHKAAQHGRQVVKIGRWAPTSQTCSACGVKDGPKPLGVRAWTCQACGAEHDRDLNAARNILNILVAAGPAETGNACGAGVRPSAMAAVGDEAGTHPSAA
jgi:IS605 OrfB family transposase